MALSQSPPRYLPYVLGFIIAVGPVSVDMYLPAFGQLAREFGAGVPQYSLASYFAGFALGQLAQGLASDRFGRRAPLTAGLGLYVLASLGCAAAPDGAVFCLCRGLAAFGAAAAIVIPRAMVRDVADGAKAAAMMSDVLLVMSVAPVLAPVLGSMMLGLCGWRMIFLAAAAYGMAGLALVARALPETLAPAARRRLSLRGGLALYDEILREPEFLGHAAVGALGMAALFAYLAGAPEVFLGEDRLSPAAFGLVLAGLGAAMIMFFRVNGRLVRALGFAVALTRGIWVWFAAGVVLCALAWSGLVGVAFTVPALLLFSLGYAGIPGNAQAGALSRHGAHAATATSLMSMLQYSAGALAGLLVGVLADGTMRPMAGLILLSALAALAVRRLTR